MARLDGKVVIITGAGSGLGRQSAQLFASECARVVVMDVLGDRAHETVRLVTEQGGTAVAVEADTTVEADVARTVQAALDTFGKLDVRRPRHLLRHRAGDPRLRRAGRPGRPA